MKTVTDIRGQVERMMLYENFSVHENTMYTALGSVVKRLIEQGYNPSTDSFQWEESLDNGLYQTN